MVSRGCTRPNDEANRERKDCLLRGLAHYDAYAFAKRALQREVRIACESIESDIFRQMQNVRCGGLLEY